ncbi:MAG: hypothetical protein PHZ26_01365 [Candidatus Gracilibacteria bacterium]|nr:hypothetical protein [Candidatus Gracilibacteria bacterium]MDD2908384.1 hypothetical protein [Candidatus Gracilibacteria bacterium]
MKDEKFMPEAKRTGKSLPLRQCKELRIEKIELRMLRKTEEMRSLYSWSDSGTGKSLPLRQKKLKMQIENAKYKLQD